MSPWPLIGRGGELQEIDALLASEQVTGVVVVGAAGVGKTRLVREALARWSASGGRCTCVVATRAAASIPLGAASRLLPAAGNTPDETPVSPLSRVARRIAADAERGPLVIGVDDAHLLDEASAALLHQLRSAGWLVPGR